ncbi:amidase [Vandammella animalimorsus]|uniref:Amidase n=3 Tax=Vandammella animalimorsus TaxID=2029117 RepID=A0A2A2T5I2_9BURK|nr:amidase [Vandammella animalimorsus]PAX16813.1 amidase [Vandammella animalimorsus]PAX20389.1 amidase [Vandammella animalimorsus]
MNCPIPTLAALADELAAGRTTALQLAEAALARAEDPAGEGARVFTRIDRERALALARASDGLRAAGIVRSPLEGVPVSVKDLFDVAGQATTAGSAVLRQAPVATHNAPVIERLLAAGAVIVGRTNMTEFAFSGLGLNPHYGTPKNPWDRATGRIPGGSSSGAAVSVTDGMAALAIGSDTGGSVRIPSALCGLTGFKPTQRRVPTAGTLPLSTSLDSVGPLAASVHCCALADAVLAGAGAQAMPTPLPLAGARLAVPAQVALDDLDEAVAAAFERALACLREAGARIHSLPVPEFAELAALHARGTLAGAEAWAWHRRLLAEQASGYDPRVRVRIEAGARMDAADYIELRAARQRWIAQVQARLAPFDALLMPTVPHIAPPIAALQADDALYGQTNLLMLRNPTLINFLDGCALSLPCHAPGDAPVGLMLAGPALADARILGLGLSVEAALARLRGN